MSLQTNRAVATLSIPLLVSGDTLGLEASCRVVFAIAKKETAYNCGVTYPTQHSGYNRKKQQEKKLKKIIYKTIQYVFV